MSDEITITRKYVIYPIASDMKEWERKVIKYVSENYEKRIQLLEQKIKHSKIPKEEKENLRKELDNLKIKYDAFQADPAITQSEINTYTYGTVRTAMEEEARKKNYILSWIYSEMIGAGVQHMETLKEKYQFISNRMNYAYRLPGNKNGSLFDEAEIHNILKGYKGRFVGRVMIRKSGSFDIRTLSGELVTVNAKFCRLLQNNSGYQMMIKRAIPLGD